MVAEVFAGLSSLKSAFDIAKGLKDIDTAASRNAAIIELQEKILAAQATQSDLTETVSALKKEVADLKAWDAEKEQYELKAISSWTFAYALKPDAQGTKPAHWICATCYGNHKRSILQRLPGNSAAQMLGKGENCFCPQCRTKLEAQF